MTYLIIIIMQCKPYKSCFCVFFHTEHSACSRYFSYAFIYFFAQQKLTHLTVWKCKTQLTRLSQ